MKKKASVIEVLGKYRIYIEEYREPSHSKTIIMVNGALATTASFGQTVRNLRNNFNVILFDLPYAGCSKQHNENSSLLTKDDEVEILLSLIERFDVNYLGSVSWGGVSALLALAKRPASIEKAVITSFSPRLNGAMSDYLARAQAFMAQKDSVGGAHLLNSTVGKHLPRLVKLHNYQYLSSLGNDESVFEQIAFHIRQIISLDADKYIGRFSSIGIPVLFINGELDEYTTADEVHELSSYIEHSHFAVVPSASHFLDLENRHAWRYVGNLFNGFLLGDASDRKGDDTVRQSDDLATYISRGAISAA
jgi:pimeloyl-ACP methyl ester carboxylesterase